MPTIDELDAMTKMVSHWRGYSAIGASDIKREVMQLTLDAKRNDLLAAMQQNVNVVADLVWNKS
jgi:hypothetical protein